MGSCWRICRKHPPLPPSLLGCSGTSCSGFRRLSLLLSCPDPPDCRPSAARAIYARSLPDTTPLHSLRSDRRPIHPGITAEREEFLNCQTRRRRSDGLPLITARLFFQPSSEWRCRWRRRRRCAAPAVTVASGEKEQKQTTATETCYCSDRSAVVRWTLSLMFPQTYL